MPPRKLLALTLMSSASACSFESQLHGGSTSDADSIDEIDGTASTDDSTTATAGTTTATTSTDASDTASTRDVGEDPQTPEDTDSTTGTTTEGNSVGDSVGEVTTVEGGDTEGITQVWSLNFGRGALNHLFYDAEQGQLYAAGMILRADEFGAPILYALRGEQLQWSWGVAGNGSADIGATGLAVGLNSTVYVAFPGYERGAGASVQALNPTGDMLASYGDAHIEIRSLKAHYQGWISVAGSARTDREHGMVGAIRRPDVDEPLEFTWFAGCDFDGGDNIIVDLLAPAAGRSDMIVRGHSSSARPWLQRCNRDASISTDWPRRQAASGRLNLAPDGRPASGSMIQDSQGQLLTFTTEESSAMLMEFSATGDWRWSQELDFSPMTLAPGPAGTFYVAGSLIEGEQALRIVDYRDEHGELIWRHSSLSDTSGDNYDAIATGEDGLVFVAGRWQGEAQVMALRPE